MVCDVKGHMEMPFGAAVLIEDGTVYSCLHSIYLTSNVIFVGPVGAVYRPEESNVSIWVSSERHRKCLLDCQRGVESHFRTTALLARPRRLCDSPVKKVIDLPVRPPRPDKQSCQHKNVISSH